MYPRDTAQDSSKFNTIWNNRCIWCTNSRSTKHRSMSLQGRFSISFLMHRFQYQTREVALICTPVMVKTWAPTPKHSPLLSFPRMIISWRWFMGSINALFKRGPISQGSIPFLSGDKTVPYIHPLNDLPSPQDDRLVSAQRITLTT